MDLETAQVLLGLKGAYSAEDVRHAFREHIKRAHPDVGPGADQPVIDDLHMARSLCLEEAHIRAHRAAVCYACGGSGTKQLRGSFQRVPCWTCKGKGTKT